MADAQDQRLGVEAEPVGLVDSAVSEPPFAGGGRPRESREKVASVPRSADDKTRESGFRPRTGSDWPFV